MSFHSLIDHFFLVLNDCTTVYLSIDPMKNILVASSLGDYEERCCKHSCAGFCMDVFSTHLGKYQGGQLLDCMIRVWLVFKETCKLSPSVVVPFCIPTDNEWKFLLLYTFSSIWYCQCSEFWIFNRYIVISHCCFNLHSADDIWQGA